MTPIVLALAIVFGMMLNRFLPDRTQVSASSEMFLPVTGSKLDLIISMIQNSYVDTVDTRQIVENTIPVLLKDLDPHTVYIPAKDMQRANEGIVGNFGGVGIQFYKYLDTVTVVKVVPGGPSEKAGIKGVTVSKKELGSQAAVEEKITEILEENNIDLIILAGYMSILSADFTRRYERRIINVHPSLIPSFCGEGFYGLRVHEAALTKGVKVTGATVHFVNELPDGGETIMQKAVRVRDGDTPETLQKRVMRLAEWKILPAAAEKISDEIVRKKAEEK